jgi:hypothetical protein
MTKEQQLFELCKKFIQEHQIYCPEKIYQTDQIMIDATEFIEDICNLVGYEDSED